MLTQRETIRFLTASQELWLRQFPTLYRRAQWHLASHLAVRAQDGAALGELYGLVKQVFLLDDATVRERIGELRGLGLCAIDPEDGPLSARTVVLPTPVLLEQYDTYLRDVGARLLALGAAVAGVRSGRLAPDDAPTRQALCARSRPARRPGSARASGCSMRPACRAHAGSTRDATCCRRRMGRCS